MDKTVGTPACAVLSLVERIRRTFRHEAATPPEKILFVKLIEMGSTVLACPAFEAATKLVGKENIYILVFEQNRSIVDLLPYFLPENVITINDSSLGKFIGGLLRALRFVRRKNIDTAIDMEGLTRSSAIITYLTGARRRVGYHNFTSEGPYRGRLFTDELSYNFQHHTSRMFLALVRSLGAPAGQTPKLKDAIPAESIVLPTFTPEKKEKEEVRNIVAQRSNGTRNAKLVLLNPNCSDLLPLRRWPTEDFIELAKRLLAEDEDILVVITGASGEQSEAEEIASGIGPPDKACSLAGYTTMRQLLTLYCISEVIVSNDSGPCHFAALTPIDIVALFGPETPLLYSPLGQGVTNITAGLVCSPCVNILNHRFSPCDDNKCMRSISVDEVFAATMKTFRKSVPTN